jgi:hypothetical protein
MTKGKGNKKMKNFYKEDKIVYTIAAVLIALGITIIILGIIGIIHTI